MRIAALLCIVLTACSATRGSETAETPPRIRVSRTPEGFGYVDRSTYRSFQDAMMNLRFELLRHPSADLASYVEEFTHALIWITRRQYGKARSILEEMKSLETGGGVPAWARGMHDRLLLHAGDYERLGARQVASKPEATSPGQLLAALPSFWLEEVPTLTDDLRSSTTGHVEVLASAGDWLGYWGVDTAAMFSCVSRSQAEL